MSTRRLYVSILLALGCAGSVLAQQPAPPAFQLWPDGAPGSEKRHGEPEKLTDGAYVSNVHDPSLTVLRADFVHGFGSCSFREPMDELAAGGWQ